MKYLILALLGFALLFGCAGNAPKASGDGNGAGTPPAPTGANTGNVSPPTSAPPAAQTPPAANPPAAAPPPPPAPPEDPNVVRIDIIASNYAFTPSTITVKKGTKVSLSVTSLDRTYGFAIMDLGINELVEAKETAVITFTPTKVGSFEIKNTHISSGAAYGMRGTLVVTE